MRLSYTREGVLLALALAAVPSFRAAQQVPVDYAQRFEKLEVMIAMRDGVKLHTEIYSPKDATEPLPILMNRTPYGISNPDKGLSNMIQRYTAQLPDCAGCVFQEIRRRYGSLV